MENQENRNSGRGKTENLSKPRKGKTLKRKTMGKVGKGKRGEIKSRKMGKPQEKEKATGISMT